MEKLNLQNYKDHGLIIENFINIYRNAKSKEERADIKKKVYSDKIRIR